MCKTKAEFYHVSSKTHGPFYEGCSFYVFNLHINGKVYVCNLEGEIIECSGFAN